MHWSGHTSGCANEYSAHFEIKVCNKRCQLQWNPGNHRHSLNYLRCQKSKLHDIYPQSSEQKIMQLQQLYSEIKKLFLWENTSNPSSFEAIIIQLCFYQPKYWTTLYSKLVYISLAWKYFQDFIISVNLYIFYCFKSCISVTLT